jgi:hypothetical protein
MNAQDRLAQLETAKNVLISLQQQMTKYAGLATMNSF